MTTPGERAELEELATDLRYLAVNAGEALGRLLDDELGAHWQEVKLDPPTRELLERAIAALAAELATVLEVEP